MKINSILLFSACFGAIAGVRAEDRTMTVNDALRASSITNFNVSGETRYPITASDNYYITKTLRTPADRDTVTFEGGSLHVGKGSTVGCMAICRGGKTVTFKANNQGLFLESGRIAPYGTTNHVKLAGTVTVLNTKVDNFYIGSDSAGNTCMTNEITGTLIGESAAQLNYRAAASGNVLLLSGATAWKGYKGTVKVGRIGAKDYPIVVEYRNGWTMPGKLIIGQDCYLYPQYGTSKATVGSLGLEDGSILGGRSGSGSHATITVTDNLSVGGQVTVRPTNAFSSGEGYWFPLLVKKASAAGELDTRSFTYEEKRDVVGNECLPRVWFDVLKDEETKDETLRLRQHKVVHLKGSDANIYGEGEPTTSSLTNVNAYQDGKLPHVDADYVVSCHGFAGTDGNQWTGYRLMTPANGDLPNGTYAFGGESLTIGTNVTFKSRATTFEIKSLRLMANSWFFPRVNVSTPSSLEGEELFVGPVQDGKGAYVEVYGKLTWTCNASLKGSGLLVFCANASGGNPGGTIVFGKSNANFFGRIAVTATSWNANKLSASVNECLRVTAADQLGGARTDFTADALVLENWGTLEAIDDIDFSTANRGVTIGNQGQMRVLSGKVLTIGNTITYGGILHKTGAGRLVLGAPSALKEAGAQAELAVDAGTVSVSDGAALKDVTVTFAAGASLAVDTASTLATGATIGAVSGGTLPVTLVADDDDYEVSNLALCTVPEGTRVAVTRPKKYSLKLTPRSNGDGTVTYVADVTRTGMLLILR